MKAGDEVMIKSGSNVRCARGTDAAFRIHVRLLGGEDLRQSEIVHLRRGSAGETVTDYIWHEGECLVVVWRLYGKAKEVPPHKPCASASGMSNLSQGAPSKPRNESPRRGLRNGQKRSA